MDNIDIVEDYLEEDEFLTEDQEAIEAKRKMDMAIFAMGLERGADEAVRDRKPLEDRWVEDMRQYKGQLDYDTRIKLGVTDSEISHNVTRSKTNGAIARISDMLFQTDTPNWGVTNTPVSEQEEEQRIKAEERREAAEKAYAQQSGLPAPGAVMPGQPSQPGQPPMPGQPGQSPEGVAQATPEQAQVQQGRPGEEEPEELTIKKKAERMAEVIEDQLEQSDYEAVGRNAIRQACMLGTGVIKGPVIKAKTKRVWVPLTDPESGKTVHVIKNIVEQQPVAEWVNVWDFFPDMSAIRIEHAEKVYQRHYMTKKQLSDMLYRDDVIHENIIETLRTEPNEVPADYLQQLRQMAGFNTHMNERRYLVWEYHGPLSIDELKTCGCDVEEGMEGMFESVVFFVAGGAVIKAAVSPMDTQERPYSVFCFEEDESCIFGEGVPRLMRDPQRMIDACWRKIDDNSGLSTGPQLVIDDTLIEPVAVNGVISWEMTAKKVWRAKKSNVDISKAFQTFNIDSHLPELQAILTMAKKFAEEETMVPLISQGQSEQNVQQTAHGMELMMNSANTMLRKPIKDWDDNITVPMITRFYDYNMQFHPDPDIKGDYNVAAKGTSALLLKETQARNLINVSKMAQTPAFNFLTDWTGLYREMVKAMQLDHEIIVKSDDVIKSEAKARAEQEAGEPLTSADKAKIKIAEMKLQAEQQLQQMKMADAKEDRAMKRELAMLDNQNKMMDRAMHEGKTIAQIKRDLEREQMKTDRERTIVADKHKSAQALPAGKVAG